MSTMCIFCRIGKREIPSDIVYEDKETLAFLDIKPHAKGHTVVIPKTHAETLFDLPEKKINAFFLGVKKTMESIKNVLQPDGFNVGWNQNAAAGQVVPHLHVHIFPRYRGDGGGSMHSIITSPGMGSVADVAALFR
ncbi:MAG TPA: HIT family protein [Candidatus Nanoarchaeia archaeon]|nr:HIT family protein [Candidatus Nanoarchaeia archaeon]